MYKVLHSSNSTYPFCPVTLVRYTSVVPRLGPRLLCHSAVLLLFPYPQFPSWWTMFFSCPRFTFSLPLLCPSCRLFLNPEPSALSPESSTVLAFSPTADRYSQVFSIIKKPKIKPSLSLHLLQPISFLSIVKLLARHIYTHCLRFTPPSPLALQPPVIWCLLPASPETTSLGH